MNFKLPRAVTTQPVAMPGPGIDFDREIKNMAEISKFAPVSKRTAELGVLTVSAVKNFAELPTKYLDDLIAGVKDKIGVIEKKADEIKADYKRRTDDLAAEIERLNDACKKSEAKMNELYEQLTDVYRPKGDQPKEETLHENP